MEDSYARIAVKENLLTPGEESRVLVVQECVCPAENILIEVILISVQFVI